MKTRYVSLIGTTALASLFTLVAAPVFAQGAPKTAETFTIEEVIVTSRYMQESLQTVPQAISAFSSEALEKLVATDLRDVSPSSPNVNIQPVVSFPNAAAIHIRGIGIQGIESSEEPAAGISIDGVFITRPAATLIDFFDVERVEVLRGPQGTSFGKNSLAGGLSIVSKDPELSGPIHYHGEATVGNYGRLDFNGAIEVPLVEDKLAIRISAMQKNYDGHYHNRYNGKSLGGEDTFTTRATIVWKPNDVLDVNLKGFYMRDRSGAPGGDTAYQAGRVLHNFNGTRLDFSGIQFVEPDDGPYVVGRDFDDYHNTDQWGFVGKVNLNFDKFNITSITGYINTEDLMASDYDLSELNFFPSVREQTHWQLSEEVRLSTRLGDQNGGAGSVDLVVGGYYLKQQFDLAQTFPTLPWLFNPAIQKSSADYAGQDSESKAVFGQAIYHATDKLNLTLGLRYTKEEKYMLRDPVGALFPILTSGEGRPTLSSMADLARAHLATGQSLEGKNSSDRLTSKLGVDYQINDDIMAYALFSQGFKAGGFGARASTPITLGPTKDNTSTSFEVGLKTEFLDNTLRFNIAAFYGTYKNLEFGVLLASPYSASGQETAQQNIGKARTKGIEIEATYQPDRYWTFNTSVGYLDAYFLDFCADLDGPSASATTPVSECGGKVARLPNGTWIVDDDYSDLKLSRAPKWKLYFRGEYRRPLSNDLGDVFIQSSVSYVSSYFTDSSMNHPAAYNKGYALVDAALGWESSDSRFRLTLWGKNLTDKTYVTGLTPTPPYFNQRYYNVPRTYGLTFAVKG